MQLFTTLLKVATCLAASIPAVHSKEWDEGQHGVNAGSPRPPPEYTRNMCMSSSEAMQVANNFQSLITNYTDELANATLTLGFIDYSDSVTELINGGCNGPQALGTATFKSRASFEEGQGSQPSIPFEKLNLWNSCKTVVLRWRSAQSPQLVTGIVVMETVKAPQHSPNSWLIDTVYSEFNSGAWLVNLGVFEPTNCSAATR